MEFSYDGPDGGSGIIEDGSQDESRSLLRPTQKSFDKQKQHSNYETINMDSTLNTTGGGGRGGQNSDFRTALAAQESGKNNRGEYDDTMSHSRRLQAYGGRGLSRLSVASSTSSHVKTVVSRKAPLVYLP